MIHFLYSPKEPYHTDRTYLSNWFAQDTLIITDVDINMQQQLDQFEHMVKTHGCKHVVVDLSHNQMPWHDVPEFLQEYTILSPEFTDWYQPRGDNIHYFPLWIWCFGSRADWLFYTFNSNLGLDADNHKTLPMMCLNRNPHPHRLEFRKMIAAIESEIVYSFGDKLLPGDHLDNNGMVSVDAGVGHPVYSQCAVNIVTETVMDRPSLSEKSVKPFAARQIPVIIGPVGVNQFYKDLGFDMFEDLVPWQTWDQEPDQTSRMRMIADFVIEFLQSGQVLDHYRSCVNRVESNKNYLHSDQLAQIILRHMPGQTVRL